MNQFTDKYKTLNNKELIKIIDNPDDYQPLALETAKAELLVRMLTPQEIENAKAENGIDFQKKMLKLEKQKAFESKIKDIGFSFADSINPIYKQSPSTNQLINILSVLFAIMFLIALFKEYGLIVFMLFDKASKWGFEMILYLLELFCIPVFTFLFWCRKKSGWILFCIYCSYSTVSSLILFYFSIKHQYNNSQIKDLFPVISSVKILWNIFFFSGCLWVLCKNSLREIYQINKQFMLIVTCSTCIFSVLIILDYLA